MKRVLAIITLLLMFTGCAVEREGEVLYNLPYIEDGYSQYVAQGQIEMCSENPESIFCEASPTVGDLQPTKNYVMELVLVLNANLNYIAESDDIWHYNYTVHEALNGDCEDVAMTLIQHMVDAGIDKKYLNMVYYLTSETSAHMFVGVETSDAGMIHVDYYTGSGGPIEPQINWHMKMTNPGPYNWIKGNIE